MEGKSEFCSGLSFVLCKIVEGFEKLLKSILTKALCWVKVYMCYKLANFFIKEKEKNDLQGSSRSKGNYYRK